jgi:protein gp37
MNITGISWTDFTWNPVTGCDKVSEGCKFCYASDVAENKRGTPAFPVGFELQLRPHKMEEPLQVRESKRIFVNSMSDLFWEKIPDEYRDEVLATIRRADWHQFLVLTKRPERMLEYSQRHPLPPNFWAGVTIENQRWAHRLDILRQTKARIRFVSAEPLLGPLDLDLTDIHWLISGGESGAHLNLPIWQHRSLVKLDGRGRWVPKLEALEWVLNLQKTCEKYDTKFFHKQWGGPTSHSGGRDLDGRTWDEHPA